jgi:hypothetical protein
MADVTPSELAIVVAVISLASSAFGATIAQLGTWLNARSSRRAEAARQEADASREYEEKVRTEYAAWFAALNIAAIEIQSLAAGTDEQRRQLEAEFSTKWKEIFGSGEVNAYRLLLLERDELSRQRITKGIEILSKIMAHAAVGAHFDVVLREGLELQKFMGETVLWLHEHGFARLLPPKK